MEPMETELRNYIRYATLEGDQALANEFKALLKALLERGDEKGFGYIIPHDAWETLRKGMALA